MQNGMLFQQNCANKNQKMWTQLINQLSKQLQHYIGQAKEFSRGEQKGSKLTRTHANDCRGKCDLVRIQQKLKDRPSSLQAVTKGNAFSL